MTVTIRRKRSPERAEIYGGVIHVASSDDFLTIFWAGESNPALTFRRDTLGRIEIDNLGGAFA